MLLVLGHGHFDIDAGWSTQVVDAFLAQNEIYTYFYVYEIATKTGKPHYQCVFVANEVIDYTNKKTNRKFIETHIKTSASYSFNHNFKDNKHRSNTVLYNCKGEGLSNIKYKQKGDLQDIFQFYLDSKITNVKNGNILYWALTGVKEAKKRRKTQNHVIEIIEYINTLGIEKKKIKGIILASLVVRYIYGQKQLSKNFNTLEGIYYGVKYHYHPKNVVRHFYAHINRDMSPPNPSDSENSD